MPRNKAAKRSTKRPATRTALTTTQKIEKDFIGVPAKLAAQLTKEINALKQKENKLKIALQKTQVAVKGWEAKVKKATSASKKATSKKQLSSAKKSHAESLKTAGALLSQLTETTALIRTSTSKQAKFTMLNKVLQQFEKDWAKGIKATPKKKISKVKSQPIASDVRVTIAETPDSAFNSDIHLNKVSSAAN